jgi:hypothetical protein
LTQLYRYYIVDLKPTGLMLVGFFCLHNVMTPTWCLIKEKKMKKTLLAAGLGLGLALTGVAQAKTLVFCSEVVLKVLTLRSTQQAPRLTPLHKLYITV